METKHLKYFKVENFKCFDSFEMDNIGQFNLIVGDNNVGKTSVLEALLVREKLSETIGAFIASIAYRNHTQEIHDYFNFEKYIFNYRQQKNELIFQFRYGTTSDLIKLNISWKENKNLNDDEFKILNNQKFLDKENLSERKSFVQYRNDLLEDISPIGVKSKPFSGFYWFIPSTEIYGDDLVAPFSIRNVDDKNFSKRSSAHLRFGLGPRRPGAGAVPH